MTGSPPSDRPGPEDPGVGSLARLPAPDATQPAWLGPAPAAVMRVSDAEREETVKVLTVACAEGRLTLEELGARVGSAYGAVTRADLVPLTADLPAAVPAGAPVPVGTPQLPRARKPRKWLVCVMSEHRHKGHWRLPPHTVAVTVMGETNIDLRSALIESTDISINLYCVMGEQTVTVPQGVEVEVTGFVLMGERKVAVDDTRPRPGVPRLHIRVLGMMGEVTVKTG